MNNATEKFGRVALTKLTGPDQSLGFKMKPAIRRQYALQMLRARQQRVPAARPKTP